MPTLHLLGTGAAFSDPHRTTTMLAFTDADSTIVVDCGGDVVQRLMQAGIALNSIDALIGSDTTADLPQSVSAALDEVRLFLGEVRAGGAIENVNAALASASAATPPSSEAMRCSSASVVGFMMRV